MKIRKTVHFYAALALYFCYSMAYANTQDLAAIEHAVVDFITKQHSPDAIINVELQRLDSRLQLTECGNNMSVNWSPGSRHTGRTTVSVSCVEPKPWRIYVRASVEKELLTWVLNSSVAKGEVLSRQLVSQQSVMLGKSGYLGLPAGEPIVNIEPWLGQVFVQAMQSGRIVGDQSLKLPNLVSKGDKVSITYQTSQLNISAKGVALSSGALHQKISVKNSASNKVVDGVVIGKSNVTIAR